MSAQSDYIENAQIEWLRGTTFPAAPANLYLALYTSGTDDASGGIEVADANYVRLAIPVAAGSWDVPVAGVTQNAILLEWAAMAADVGVISDWAIHDAASGGNRIWRGALTTPLNIAAGNVPRFPIGALDISCTGAWGNYLRNALINWMRGTTFPAAPANVYVAAFTSATDADAGGTEVAGGSYARVAISGAPGSWAAAGSGGTDGHTQNVAAATFPLATAIWGLVSHMALHDAATVGNRLCHGPLSASIQVNAGGRLSVPAGVLDLTWA